MRKTWIIPDVDVLDVKETAFGVMNPNNTDSEKTAVTDDQGNILGWKQEFGEAAASL